MKKKNLFLMFLMAAVLTTGMVSCSNAEKGESWDTWVMRNQLNSSWSLDYVLVGGQYKRMGDDGFDFYLTMKLRAEGRTFEAERFFYNKSTGTADQSTLVKKTGVYTIDEPNKTITLIDSEGKPFIRLSNINFDTGSMSANLLFYDLNQAYIVGFNRSFSF